MNELIKNDEKIFFDEWRHINPDLSLELLIMYDEGLSFKDFAGVKTTSERLDEISVLITRHIEARKQGSEEDMKKAVNDLEKLIEAVVTE